MAHGVHDVEDLTGQWVVAAVDFEKTRLYALGDSSRRDPERVANLDPASDHKLEHHAGTFFRVPEHDWDTYWRTLADVLGPADRVLLLGHGSGKANATHQLVAYLEKHRSDVAALIVGDIRCDIDDLTDAQVLRLGEQFFGIAPARASHG